jgi:hypothetical protein
MKQFLLNRFFQKSLNESYLRGLNDGLRAEQNQQKAINNQKPPAKAKTPVKKVVTKKPAAKKTVKAK